MSETGNNSEIDSNFYRDYILGEEELDRFLLIENTVNSIAMRDLSKYDLRSLRMVLETLEECLERIDYKVNESVSQKNKQDLRNEINKLLDKIRNKCKAIFDQN